MSSPVESFASEAAPQVIVKPLTVHIGAEIGGVDLTRPLSADEISAIRRALLDWKVIFFRRQSIDHRQHIEFARQFDRQAAHLDPVAAAQTPFGGLIASGAHTFAVWNRVNLDVNGDIAWIAGVGFDDFRFPNPMRAGVEFKATSVLESARPSSSDPERGVVQHRYELVTRDSDVIFTARCTALVHRR